MTSYAIYKPRTLVGFANDRTIEGAREIARILGEEINVEKITEEEYTTLRAEQDKILMGDFEGKIQRIKTS